MIKWDELKDIVFEKIDDGIYFILPHFAYRFYKDWLTYSSWKRRIKFFFQRMVRGFDDSETWCLDYTYYNWIYPRLKRFSELTVCWPGNNEYPTFESWKEDLDKRVTQLKAIIDYSWDESSFPHREYLTDEYLHSFSNWKEYGDDMLNSLAYADCKHNFNKWFSEHIGMLWW